MTKKANLAGICSEITSTVDGALGCAVVDLGTGLLLAEHHTVPNFSQAYVDAVASAAVAMFRGKGIVNIERLLSEQRGEKVEKLMQEVQMTTVGTYHFMALVPEKPDALIVLITNRNANLGAGWSALRSAMAEIGPNCP